MRNAASSTACPFASAGYKSVLLYRHPPTVHYGPAAPQVSALNGSWTGSEPQSKGVRMRSPNSLRFHGDCQLGQPRSLASFSRRQAHGVTHDHRFCARSLTNRSMRSAAASGTSCSHTRTTTHPASSNAASILLSRATFASILWRQKLSFFLGQVAWSGQPCQKQPLTYTATRGPRKARSAFVSWPRSGLWSFRYRSPRANRIRRIASSAAVSVCLIRRIRRRVAVSGAVVSVGCSSMLTSA